MELKLYNTTSSKLNSLNIVGGQLIVSKDDSCLYVDIDSIGRLKITDWIELETGIIIPEISIDEKGIIKHEEVYNLKPKIKTIIKKYM